MLIGKKNYDLETMATTGVPDQRELTELLTRATMLGASEAAIVDAGQITVNEKFARLCASPGCPNYGGSASCPPAVGGPEAFRAWVSECRLALVVRIDVPITVLYSSERFEVMGLLHEVVSGVEQMAQSFGYVLSRGFAGGSCKQIFCASYPACQAITTDLGCRNPEKARTSMSGFGIDVGHLMQLANWPEKQMRDQAGNNQAMSWIAGLILVG